MKLFACTLSTSIEKAITRIIILSIEYGNLNLFTYSCNRLGIIALAYLWRRDQEELLQEMIDCNIKAIIVKVAALGLHPNKHLGLTLTEIKSHLVRMVSQDT